MKSSELHLLLLLGRKGAFSQPVSETTSSLASELGVSQQTISRWLLQLSAEGLIERTGTGIRLSEKAEKELKQLVSFPKQRPSASLALSGRVVPGIRDGKYYMSLPGYARQFEKKLGFKPFPGTLNLKLSSPTDVEAKQKIAGFSGISISSFKQSGRFFGPAKCFRASINGKVQGAVVLPSRSHYGGDIIEVIASVSLRKRLGLHNNSQVRLQLFV